MGQNKSQVLMRFYALISVLFFPTVTAFYFIPGHSHMICDRVVSWNRKKMKGKNLYTPETIAGVMNLTKSVEAEVLKGTDSDFPFRVGWKSLINRFFRKLPDGYTSNYVFEFSKRIVTMRTLCTTPDKLVQKYDLLKMSGDYRATRLAIIKALFGVETLETVSIIQLTLPKNPDVVLKESKLLSLARKYFSIPVKYREYSPEVKKQLEEVSKEKYSSLAGVKRNRPGSAPSGSKKRRVGRSKKKRRPPLRSIATTPSILTFFSLARSE